jgi:hypothetical protein
MTASVWRLRTAQKVVLALVGISIGIMGTLHSASALTAQQCYKHDSGCTQFCGHVTGDMRYECFGICDRMLDRCLDIGVWTDHAQIDPGTGKPPDKRGLLTGLLLRMIMILGDTDGDGVLSPKEIEALRAKIWGVEWPNSGSETPGQR